MWPESARRAVSLCFKILNYKLTESIWSDANVLLLFIIYCHFCTLVLDKIRILDIFTMLCLTLISLVCLLEQWSLNRLRLWVSDLEVGLSPALPGCHCWAFKQAAWAPYHGWPSDPNFLTSWNMIKKNISVYIIYKA